MLPPHHLIFVKTVMQAGHHFETASNPMGSV